MKSSEFERLGDFSRKQKMGFNDALNHTTSINNGKKSVSSVISTDKTFMSIKKNHCVKNTDLDDFIIKLFLDIRGYSEKIALDNKNFIYYSNGKSILEINPRFDCICNGYKFEEHYKNQDVKSKGSFPSDGSGISPYIDRDYYKRDDYNGSEYFRQAFLYEDKLAVVSLKLKKVDEISGWCCYYPKFILYMEISYFDINNNKSLKGLNNNAKLDIISLTNSFLSKVAVADQVEIINIKDKLIGEVLHSDSSFFIDISEQYRDLICKSLLESFNKIEKYLGVNLEFRERNCLLKKLFLNK